MLKIVDAWKAYQMDGEGSVFLDYEEAVAASDYEMEPTEGYALVNECERVEGFFLDFFEAEEELCLREGGVAIGPDYLAIYDKGEELVRWMDDEWLEEPELALNLANAVRMYYTKGPGFIRKLIEKE